MFILLKNASEWKGRSIAYLGGSGISAFSYQVSATSPLATGEATELLIAQVAMQMEAQLNTNPLIAQSFDAMPAQAVAASMSSVVLTPSNLISIAGLLVVIGRLIFDVWKYFDVRKQTRLEHFRQSQSSKSSESNKSLNQGVNSDLNLAASKVSSQSKVPAVETTSQTVSQRGSPPQLQAQSRASSKAKIWPPTSSYKSEREYDKS